MAKSTIGYWNTLAPEHLHRWTPVAGLEGSAEEVTLSIDPLNGEYTRLTRFLPGADTTPFGAKTHSYPEKSSSSAAASTITPLLSGSRQETTQAAPLASCTARSGPIPAALCWKCHFLIALPTPLNNCS